MRIISEWVVGISVASIDAVNSLGLKTSMLISFNATRCRQSILVIDLTTGVRH